MFLSTVLPILLVVLVLVLIYDNFQKSKQLSHIVDEIARVKREEEVNERVQRSRDEYTAMIVHELRSPLSVIKGASDLVLKEAGKLSAEQIETLLSQIRSSSEGLLKIVNDILDVSKMEAGKFSVDKSPEDLNTLLKDECAYYSSLAEVRGLELVRELDGSIPRVSIDADRLKQVMNNLISNSIKYTPPGGKITVSSSFKGNFIEVSIRDTGIGVSDTDKPLLFHKFAQPNNHEKMEGESTGLGLVISKGIIEAHGGSIWYEANNPKGAKFTFKLPIT
ncbi:HAMP domain-containing histidine kinase [Patescibacteria group bacterium]|nr:HAMP domain-containing histidine kinase [Patescibacteria group bacterium]